jgi:monofunctional biosynthetic peptidoglycan transglycosylase
MPGTPKPPVTRPRWRRWLARAAEVVMVTGATGALALECSVPATARLADGNPTSTAFIDLRHAQAAAAGKPWHLRWEWRRLGRISRYLRAAVVYSEDATFYAHAGVDWSAIENAAEHDAHGVRVIGGSTITQQLAKNLYLSPARSVIRKARELLIAFSLEDHLTKQRILELYLNVVEWGDGIFGAEAAAHAWFGCSASALSPAQAARLAIALPNPYLRAPNVQSAELTQKAVRLIRLFRMQGLVDAAQERVALDDVGAQGEVVLPDGNNAPGPPAPGPPIAPTPAPATPIAEPVAPAAPSAPTAPEAPAPAPDAATPTQPPGPVTQPDQLPD